MAWVGFMFSLFMAAATTTHQDSYRFRLMFIPFLMYIALGKRSSRAEKEGAIKQSAPFGGFRKPCNA
jgi:hypothetical protein